MTTARGLLDPCRACPRRCGAHRLAGESGSCRIGELARVASCGAHFGEEAVLVGPGGSGTVFFTGCNLDCVFCQNFDISHGDGGTPVTTDQLAGLMLSLAQRGCSNVNLVSPTHVGPQVAEAVAVARDAGLEVPVVYNSGGYDSVEMLRLLEGLVDVYMPDFKYSDPSAGAKYSGVPDYPARAAEALAEMYRQVGPLQVDQDGLARRGMLVRHLVLPMDQAGSEAAVETVARIAPGAAINVMGQYRPSYRACEFSELLTAPKASEVRRLRLQAAAAGLVRVD